MVRLATPFYTAQLPQENTYEALPEGQYIASVSKIELKYTKAGNGQYLNVQFTIVDGQLKGKTFFDKINISNINQQAVEIGLARLNTLLSVGGLHALEDTEQLNGITVLATIGFAKELYQGQKQNTVARIESPNKQQSPVQQQSYVAQAPVAQPVYQQTQPVQNWQQQQSQPQQNWQQPQAPVQQYAPVAQQQAPVQQWQSQPQQPVAPTIQSTQEMLSDSIPF